ncbi:MAG: hypothetical protein AAF235_00605 [Planctomycetota bacterium]
MAHGTRSVSFTRTTAAPVTIVRRGTPGDGWAVSAVRPVEDTHPAVKSSASSLVAGLAGYAGTMAIGMMMLGVLTAAF